MVNTVKAEKQENILYKCINMLVILAAVAYFLYEYKDTTIFLSTRGCYSIVLLVLCVVLVHMIKALRLYVALYGTSLSLGDYLKVYCKVTPVSMILPFKVGEFYRMYCYGRQMGSYLKGIVIILFDRFMDSAALLTALLLVWIFNSGKMTALVYMLLIFLVVVLLLYFVYPGIYRFWKKYLLQVKVSNNVLNMLKLLESINHIYAEIESLAKGRGFILYIISIAAWCVEIGGVSLLAKKVSADGCVGQVMDYLNSAMTGGANELLRGFIFIGVIGLLALYLLISIVMAANVKNTKRTDK